MLEKMEDYSIHDARSVPIQSYGNLSDKDKKKVEQNLRAREEGKENNTKLTFYLEQEEKEIQVSASSAIRIEVTKNDGQKAMFKPVLVKSKVMKPLV